MILLRNATIVTSEREGIGSILIDGDTISRVYWKDDEDFNDNVPGAQVYDATGKHVMAGGVDAHVHFRDPGLTHKGDMVTESRAAAAGGVTTVFDMPNTVPPTISGKALAEKKKSAEGRCLTKIAFHIGATNSNADEISSLVNNGDASNGLEAKDISGIKIFMGSSTGNMLVDESSTLARLFAIREKPILVHCEDEATIKANLAEAKERYGEGIPFEAHPEIRSRKACILSSIKALELAMKYGTRLVLCHISTKEELNMVRAAKASNKNIIAETSCNYLWFSDEDYARLGSKVKCNPAVKTIADRSALREGLLNGLIDTIGSDHAPHLLSEKNATYTKAPSGLPTIQQSLPVLLTIAKQEQIPLSRIASVFSEKASDLYRLDTGKIAAGMKADLVVFDYDKEFIVKDEDQYSKSGWTPYAGEKLNGFIETVFIDGKTVVTEGKINS